MVTYRQLIKAAETKLEKIEASYLARLFMLELTREANLDLYLIEDDVVLDEIKATFDSGLKRLLKEEPLAYVLGYSWFYGRKFLIDKRVLIPRKETEQLIGEALIEIEDYFQNNQNLVVADIGTGSGAIGITLALEEPNFQVFASDISETALEVALDNATSNQAAITFFQGDLLKPLIEKQLKVDVIVCNPPYIDHSETIESSVYDYEPHLALFGKESNYYFYQELLKDAHLVLNNPALIIFEMGYQMREGLEKLTEKYFPKARYKTILDYQGLDRFFVITL